MNQILELQHTPHISPFWPSYGVSIVGSWGKSTTLYRHRTVWRNRESGTFIPCRTVTRDADWAGVPFLSVPRATSSPYSLQRVFGRATTGTVRGPLCDTHLSGSCSLYYRGVRSLYNTLSPFKGHFRQAEAWCRASIRISHRKGVILW